MKTRLTLPLTALALTSASFAAQAPAKSSALPSPIKLSAATYVVTQVTENGKTVEKLVDGSQALPGSLLQMSQKVQNVSARTVPDIIVFGGGIIPDQDLPKLKEMGVGQVFTPGASTEDAAAYLREAVRERWAQQGEG